MNSVKYNGLKNTLKATAAGAVVVALSLGSYARAETSIKDRWSNYSSVFNERLNRAYDIDLMMFENNLYTSEMRQEKDSLEKLMAEELDITLDSLRSFMYGSSVPDSIRHSASRFIDYPIEPRTDILEPSLPYQRHPLHTKSGAAITLLAGALASAIIPLGLRKRK